MQKFGFKLHLDSMRLIPAGMMVVWGMQQSLAYSSLDMFMQSYALLGLVLLSAVFAIYLCGRDALITRYEMMVLSFLMIVMASSLINANDPKNWAFACGAIVAPLFLFRYYSHSIHVLLIGLLIGLTLSIYLGLHDILTHPERWLNMERGESAGYLLGGNYNQMAPIIMTAVTVNMLCLKVSRWFILNLIPLMIVSGVILFIVNSSTALAGMSLMLLMTLLPSTRLQRIGIYGILVSVVLFEIFVCFQGKGFENNELARWLIIDVLGKDMTFTYRTDMWDSALRVIVKSPLFGHGFPNSEWYIANMSSFAIGPHNVVMGILIYGGVIALGLYLMVIYMTFKRTSAYNDRFSNVALISLAILFLMMLFEVYSIAFIIILITIAYYYPELNEACGKTTEATMDATCVGAGEESDVKTNEEGGDKDE